MDYFIETEEYEKCAEIKILIKKIKIKNARKYKEDSSKEFSSIFKQDIK